jgi:hypothetical protein
MTRPRDVISEITKGTFFELIANELAGWLRKSIGGIVVAVFLALIAWAKGWLMAYVTVTIWMAILYSLVLVSGVLFVSCLIRWRRKATSSSGIVRPYDDLLWRVDAHGKIIEGPFCPNCKLSMTQHPKDELEDILAQLDGGRGLTTELECRGCGLQKRYDMSLNLVKRDIEDRIAAESR